MAGKSSKDVRSWFPNLRKTPFSAVLKRHSVPAAALVAASLVLSAAFLMCSSALTISPTVSPAVLEGNGVTLTAPVLLWNYSLGETAFPLTVTGGAVYISTNSNITALNAADGSQLWSNQDTEGDFSSFPLLITPSTSEDSTMS